MSKELYFYVAVTTKYGKFFVSKIVDNKYFWYSDYQPLSMSYKKALSIISSKQMSSINASIVSSSTPIFNHKFSTNSNIPSHYYEFTHDDLKLIRACEVFRNIPEKYAYTNFDIDGKSIVFTKASKQGTRAIQNRLRDALSYIDYSYNKWCLSEMKEKSVSELVSYITDTWLPF